MAELYVNGFYDVSFHDMLTGQKVSEEKEALIIKKMNDAEYVFGMETKTIFKYDTLGGEPSLIPLYRVEFEATGSSLTYEWDI